MVNISPKVVSVLSMSGAVLVFSACFGVSFVLASGTIIPTIFVLCAWVCAAYIAMRPVSEGVTSLAGYTADVLAGWATNVSARIRSGRSSNTESGDAGESADNEADAERGNSPSRLKGIVTEGLGIGLYSVLIFGLHQCFLGSVSVSLAISSYSWISGALISIGSPHLLAVGIESSVLFSCGALSASFLLAGAGLILMAMASAAKIAIYSFSYIKDRYISRGEAGGQGCSEPAGDNENKDGQGEGYGVSSQCELTIS